MDKAKLKQAKGAFTDAALSAFCLLEELIALCVRPGAQAARKRRLSSEAKSVLRELVRQQVGEVIARAMSTVDDPAVKNRDNHRVLTCN